MFCSDHLVYLMYAMVEVPDGVLGAVLDELRNISASNAAITRQHQIISDQNAANAAAIDATAAAIMGRLANLERAINLHPPQHSASGVDDASACATVIPSSLAHAHSYPPVPVFAALPTGGQVRFAVAQQYPPQHSASGGDDAAACAPAIPSSFAHQLSYAPVPVLAAPPSGGQVRFADPQQPLLWASVRLVFACPVCGAPQNGAQSFKSHVSKLYHAAKRRRPKCCVDISRPRHRDMVVNFPGHTDAARGACFVNQFYDVVREACSSQKSEHESHTAIYGWLRQRFPCDVEMVPGHVSASSSSSSSRSPSSSGFSGPPSSAVASRSTSRSSIESTGPEFVALAPGYE